MFLYRLLLSRKVIVCGSIVAIFSLLLTVFPLIGTLGFEYSLIIAFVCSFISIFISVEYINIDLKSLYPYRQRYSDLISSCFFVNFIILLVPLIIGIVSSILKSDCYLKEGIIFFVLIPLITVIFTSSLGLLIGYLFPRRGFFIGSITVILIILYSLWILYNDPPIFSYNHIFGFFPGPLYDEIIYIDKNLLVFRMITLCWSVFFISGLKLIHDYSYKHIGAGSVILLLVFGVILFFTFMYSNQLGIRHTREYLIENYFTDSYETENFIIYFLPRSKVSDNVVLIAMDHEFRYKQLSDYLNIKGTGKIVSYIYPDEITRKKLIGAGETTIANPIQKEIHLVYDIFPHPVLKHELAHVLSSEFGTRILKISPSIGLVEGLAVAADWQEIEGYNLHQWSRSILVQNDKIGINGIIGWGFWAENASTSYTLMGSFVRYLIDTYGIEKFKSVYRSGEFNVYGKELDSIIDDWEKFLLQYYISYEMPSITKRIYGKPSIFRDTCPRKSAYLSELGIKEFENQNYYMASQYFEKALSYSPGSYYILESLAYSYYQDKNYSKLESLIENKQSIPDITQNIITNLIANAKWVKGDIADAGNVYKELGKSIVPLDISNEIDIKLDVIDKNNEIVDSIKSYYTDRDMLNRVVLLEGVIRGYPDYAVSYYLLGNILFYEWNFGRALKYLIQSEKIGLPSINLAVDNSRLLGISLFIDGEYEEAARIFEEIKLLKNGGRYYNLSNDFLERIHWIKSQDTEF